MLNYSVIIFIAYIVIVVQAGEHCKTPYLENGTCIDIRKCNYLLDILTNAPKPIDEKTRRKLLSYQCGEESNYHVCCIESSKQIVVNTKLQAHPNVNLIPHKSCGYIPATNKIFIGNRTFIEEFLYVVLLNYENSNNARVEHLCTGTLINENHVLTSAECLTPPANYKLVSVSINDFELNNNVDCDPYEPEICLEAKIIPVAGIKIHPHYESRTYNNNIGLIKLAAPARDKNNAYIACLPIFPSLNYKELRTYFSVPGWGLLHNQLNRQTRLHTTVWTVNSDECKAIYNTRTIDDTKICAGEDPVHELGIIDNGAPLLTVEKIEDYVVMVQYGIYSTGFTSKQNGRATPQIYTNVEKYLIWILDNLTA